MIGGGVIMAEGGGLLLLGIEYGIMKRMFDSYEFLSPELLWTFIFIGIISLLIGLPLLLTGLNKRKIQKENDASYHPDLEREF